MWLMVFGLWVADQVARTGWRAWRVLIGMVTMV